jgi:pyruvate formate lyase activating enzyme
MKECELYRKEKGFVRCLACAHKCAIKDGKTGICRVRKNFSGELYSLVYGRIAAMHVDPIEKKPLYKFFPGSVVFSIGTVGCNFRCEWCQNSELSMEWSEVYSDVFTPEQIVDLALKNKCKGIAYTYNEPCVFLEFVKDCAVLAKKKRLKNVLVTNGYFSLESFEYLKKYIDAANIDLKSFNEKTYKKYCGASLKPVLENIERFVKAGIHTEVTTLVVPGVNDNMSELENIAKFLSSVDKNIVWHISRFFPMYKMTGKKMTPLKTLERAYVIGKKYLKNVYMGNI